MRHLRAAVPAAVFAVACAGPDLDPPPMPHVDTVRSPTGRPAQLVTGSAEYGATIKVTRTPPFGGPEAPIDTTADPFTARWEMLVPLVDGENTFEFTATDSANLTSAPRQVKITRSLPLPVAVRLQILQPVVSATSGELRAIARIELGEEGVPLEGFAISFKVGSDYPSAPAPVSATTDAQGIARAAITGLSSVGAGKLIAESADDPDISDAADFVVEGGLAASLVLTLKPVGSTAAPSDNVTIAAGTDVEITVVIKDGEANTLNVPFMVTAEGGAFAQGNRLKNFIAAGGPYRVIATVTGAPTEGGQVVSDVAAVTVTAGAATVLTALPPARATAGVAFPIQVQARDAHGNAVAGAAITGASSTGAKADPQFVYSSAAKTATFKSKGTRSLNVDATVGTANLSASAEVEVDPAEAATVALTLDGTDRDTNTTTLDVKPDDTITLSADVRDAFGNDVSALVDIVTEPPLRVGGWKIEEPGRAGSYTAVASVVGAPGVQPSSVSFNVIAGDPSSAAFSLAASTAAAGQKIAVSSGVYDAWGNRTAHTVVPASTGGGFANDANAQISFTTAGGPYDVTATVLGVATLVVCDSNSSTPPPACPRVTVSAAAPNALVVTVPNQPLSAVATTPFDITTTLTDAFNNTVSAPIECSIVPKQPMSDPPDVIVAGGKIYGLNRAGTYVAVCRVPGTAVESLPTDIVVAPGATSRADLVLGANSTWTGAPIPYKVFAWDAAGNVLSPGTVNFKVVDSSDAILAAGTDYAVDPATITILTGADVYRVTACLGDCAQGATIKDSEVVTILEPPDTEAPVVSITSIPASLAESQPIPVTVEATDNRAVVRIYVSASGALNTSSAFEPTFPATQQTHAFATVGADTPNAGEIRVRAAAIDGAGNIGYSSVSTLCVSNSNMPAYGTTTDYPVLKCTLARGSAIDEPYGIGRDAAGNIFVAARNRHAVAKVDATTWAVSDFIPQAKFTNGATAGPQGLAIFSSTSMSRLFVSVKNTNGNTNEVFKADLPSNDIAAWFTGTVGSNSDSRIYQLFTTSDRVWMANASSNTASAHRILRFDPAPSAAGSAEAQFTLPVNTDKARGVCVDGTAAVFATYLTTGNKARVARSTSPGGSGAAMTDVITASTTGWYDTDKVGECAVGSSSSVIAQVSTRLVRCTTSGTPACKDILSSSFGSTLGGVLFIDNKTLLVTDPDNDVLIKLIATDPAKTF